MITPPDRARRSIVLQVDLKADVVCKMGAWVYKKIEEGCEQIKNDGYETKEVLLSPVAEMFLRAYIRLLAIRISGSSLGWDESRLQWMMTNYGDVVIVVEPEREYLAIEVTYK